MIRYQTQAGSFKLEPRKSPEVVLKKGKTVDDSDVSTLIASVATRGKREQSGEYGQWEGALYPPFARPFLRDLPLRKCLRDKSER